MCTLKLNKGTCTVPGIKENIPTQSGEPSTGVWALSLGKEAF